MPSFLLLLGIVWMTACSPSAPSGKDPCPGPRPAFRLSIRAFDQRPLPAATRVHIEYGGNGEEDHVLAQPPASPSVLFCSSGGAGGAGGAGAGGVAGAGTGGAAGHGGVGSETQGEEEPGAVRSLQCELWTDGAANVKIEAPGLATYEQELAAMQDRCGIKTTEMAIELEEMQGGSGGQP